MFLKLLLIQERLKDQALFIAIKGHKFDGHNYINQAIENGASVVVCENLPVNFEKSSVVGISVLNLQKRHFQLLLQISLITHLQELTSIGVTGTNGKTTISSLLNNLFNELKFESGLISTISINYRDYIENSKNTTPDPITINFHLSEMIKKQIKVCLLKFHHME